MEMVLCIDIEKWEKYKLLCKLFVSYLVEFKLWGQNQQYASEITPFMETKQSIKHFCQYYKNVWIKNFTLNSVCFSYLNSKLSYLSQTKSTSDQISIISTLNKTLLVNSKWSFLPIDSYLCNRVVLGNERESILLKAKLRAGNQW